MMKKLFTLLATLFISLTTYAETQNFEYIKSYVPAKITIIYNESMSDTIVIKTNDQIVSKMITYKIINNELQITPRVPMSTECINNLADNDIRVIIRTKTQKSFIAAPNTKIVSETYNNSGNF